MRTVSDLVLSDFDFFDFVALKSGVLKKERIRREKGSMEMTTIKPVILRSLALHDDDYCESYLSTLSEKYGAAAQNIAAALDCDEKALRCFVAKRGLRVVLSDDPERAERCRESEPWQEFMARTPRGLPAQSGCFAFAGDPRQPGKKDCLALKRLYCREGACPFFKPGDVYERELKRYPLDESRFDARFWRVSGEVRK